MWARRTKQTKSNDEMGEIGEKRSGIGRGVDGNKDRNFSHKDSFSCHKAHSRHIGTKKRPVGPPLSFLTEIYDESAIPKKTKLRHGCLNAALRPVCAGRYGPTPCHALFFCYFCIFITSCRGLQATADGGTSLNKDIHANP